MTTKTSTLALLCALVLLAGLSQAQTRIIKYAPLLSGGYEQVLSEKRSFYVGASFYSAFDVTAIGLKGEYRFYTPISLAKRPASAPQGLWVAPTAMVWFLSERFFDTRATCVGAGGILGHQGVIKDRFTIEPAIGVAFGGGGANGDFGVFSGVAIPLTALRFGYVLN